MDYMVIRNTLKGIKTIEEAKSLFELCYSAGYYFTPAELNDPFFFGSWVKVKNFVVYFQDREGDIHTFFNTGKFEEEMECEFFDKGFKLTVKDPFWEITDRFCLFSLCPDVHEQFHNPVYYDPRIQGWNFSKVKYICERGGKTTEMYLRGFIPLSPFIERYQGLKKYEY